MRRWLTAMALGGVAAVTLSGCGTPGVDGALTDDWPAIGEPKAFVPAAKVCHKRFDDTGYLNAYNPVDCKQSHLVETVHVGTFTGEHAERVTPPPAGSPGARAAYAECDKKATEFVGAEWRNGRLSLRVVLASERAWAVGGRWFRCDLTEMKNLDDWEGTMRTGSLAGALGKASPLRYGCFNPKIVDGELERMQPVACTKPHRSEYVGVYVAPNITYDSFNDNPDRTHQGCHGVLAGYAKVPNDGTVRYRAGSVFYAPGEKQWKAGNRGVQCFAYFSDRSLTRSIKGVGTKGLPIR